MNQPLNLRSLVNGSLWWPCALIFLIAIGPFAVGISRLVYPFDTGHFESVVWMPTQILLAGNNPYDLQWAQNPPFSLSVYGPLYYAISAVGFAFFGVQFWFGRLLSLLALGTCAVCIIVLVQRSTARRDLALLGAGLFLTQVPTVLWVGLQRPDWIALALSLGALCCCYVPRVENSGDKYFVWRAIAAALLLVAALFCRQTSVVPFFIAAAILWRATRNSSRLPLLLFLASYTIAVVAIIVVLNTTSRGGFIAQQWILPSRVARSFDISLAYVAILLTSCSAWVVLITTWAEWRRFQTVPRSGCDDSISNQQSANDGAFYKTLRIWLIASSVLAFVTTSRDGSNLNYWLESCAVAALVAPLTLHFMQASRHVVALCFGAVVLAACTVNYHFWGIEMYHWKRLPAIRATVAALQQHTPPNQPVFALHPDVAVAANRPYWFNDAFQYSVSVPSFHRFYLQATHEKHVTALVEAPILPDGYRLMSKKEIWSNRAAPPTAIFNQTLKLAVRNENN